MGKDIYVVVAENNKTHTISGKPFNDDGGPIVFEQYVNTASLENMRERAEQLDKNYGPCRIAKLVFVD